MAEGGSRLSIAETKRHISCFVRAMNSGPYSCSCRTAKYSRRRSASAISCRKNDRNCCCPLFRPSNTSLSWH